MLVYCDSVILIYFLDHAGPFNVRAANRLAMLAKSGDQVVISDLVRLECRVRPLKLADTAKVAVFDAFFARSDVRRAACTPAVFDLATAIRAANNFKLADSLHRAAAIEFGCNRFLTNDTRLAACSDIAVEVLP